VSDEFPTSAADIAWNVRNNLISAADILERHLAAIDAREGDIHAFNLVLADEARARAAEIDDAVSAGRDPGPLAGVPIALKDNMCTRGIPTTCSSRILEGWRPALRRHGGHQAPRRRRDRDRQDEPRRVRDGVEHRELGVRRHPQPARHDTGAGWIERRIRCRRGRRVRAASLGSDTGGSIRQPAALCGVVGVKPTYGAVSRYGLVAFASSLDQIGPFAHDVADAALVLEAISGHDQMDSTSIRQGPLEISRQLDMGVAGLRVGRITDLPDGASPDVAARLEEAFDALRAAGAELVDVEVPAFSYGLTAYYLIAPAEASSNLARYDGVRFGHRVDAPDTNAMYMATRTDGFGAEVKRRIMLGTYALSAGYYDAYYGRALKVRRRIAADFAAAYERADVLLTPASPTVAFHLGDKTSDPMSMYLCDTYTIPSNLTGDPGMSVPFGTGDDGLPVGVQVLAPALQESRMFRTAAELERRAPR
jgi:aspartyl-tRNA(Asn)/glutamyl-tRNA(Gln) amidotransferase subunit A